MTENSNANNSKVNRIDNLFTPITKEKKQQHKFFDSAKKNEEISNNKLKSGNVIKDTPLCQSKSYNSKTFGRFNKSPPNPENVINYK